MKHCTQIEVMLALLIQFYSKSAHSFAIVMNVKFE